MLETLAKIQIKQEKMKSKISNNIREKMNFVIDQLVI